jgi:hypothetical protein
MPKPRTDPPGRKKGRPKARIDLAQLEKLAGLQCTDEEIAAWFGVTQKTIQRRRKSRKFAEVIERGRAKGRISLRRAQFQAAQAGNIAAQIWLGKQILGQRDKWDIDHSGEVHVKAALPEWLLQKLKSAGPTNPSLLRSGSTPT